MWRLLLVLELLLVPALAKADCADPSKAVEGILSQWRSSDRFIDGGTLREEAELYLSPQRRERLADCSQAQVLKALNSPQLVLKWGLTRADGENILKIRKLTQHSRQMRRPFVNVGLRVHGFQNEIVDMTQEDLDRLLKESVLPLESAQSSQAKTKNRFSYLAHKLKRLALKSGNDTGLDNDLYAFTVAAVFYNLGMHKSKEVVFENSSRGADQYPYMVAGGQDQVVDLLENIRFTKWDIEVIRRRLEAKMYVDPGFWDWLANWSFKGEVRAVPVGTVIFPHTPTLYVTSDPASAIIVESLINPWMSSMTNLLTTAVRDMQGRGEIKIVTEAGTRRVVTGHISSMTGLMGGAQGTSNVLMAELNNATAYGTMSHASVMAFPSEMEAFEAFAKFSKAPTLLLPDTYNLLDGVRMALRAAGPKVSTVRQDSNIVSSDHKPLSTEETVQEIRKVWTTLGRENWRGPVTNDLTEKTLHQLGTSGSDVEVASVGGAFAASSVGVSHGNFVYKLVEMRDVKSGEVRYPIKIANGAKSTEPGEKDLYRMINLNGHAAYDLKVKAGSKPEILGLTPQPLLETIFKGDHRVRARATAQEVSQRTLKDLDILPAPIKEFGVTRSNLGDGNYPVQLHVELQSIKEEAILAVTPSSRERILVVLGSHSANVLEAVNELFKNQSAPMGFDETVMLTSIGSLDSRVLNTLEDLHQRNPGDQISVLINEDLFWTLGRASKSSRQMEQFLIEESIVVVKRDGPKRLSDFQDTQNFLKKMGFEERPNGFVGPKSQRIEFFYDTFSCEGGMK